MCVIHASLGGRAVPVWWLGHWSWLRTAPATPGCCIRHVLNHKVLGRHTPSQQPCNASHHCLLVSVSSDCSRLVWKTPQADQAASKPSVRSSGTCCFHVVAEWLHWPCLLQFVVLQVLSAADRTCGAGCLWRGTHKTWRKQQQNPRPCLACQAPSIMHPEWPPLHRQPHSLVYVAFTCGYQPLLCCAASLPCPNAHASAAVPAVSPLVSGPALHSLSCCCAGARSSGTLQQWRRGASTQSRHASFTVGVSVQLTR